MQEKRGVKERGGWDKRGKKAVSPVIATVLLVAIVIILIAIIFLWAMRFIPEMILKNDGIKDKPIEQVCKDAVFEAQLKGAGNNFVLDIKNTGNIPISSLNILKISKFKKDTEVIKIDLTKGEAKSVALSGISDYEKINAIPMLLGKVKNGKIKEYTCSEDNGKEIEV